MNQLVAMTKDIRNRAEKGAVSIEYLAIAIVVAALLVVVLGAFEGLDLAGPFSDAVDKIFNAG